MRHRILLALVPELRCVPQDERRQVIEQARYLAFRKRANNVKWVMSMACLLALCFAGSAIAPLVAGLPVGGLAQLFIILVGFAVYQAYYWRLLRPEIARIACERTIENSSASSEPIGP